MKTTSDFIKNGSHEEFLSVLQYYGDAIKMKASQKKKNDEGLVQLDKWYQEDLEKLVRSRSPSHITRDELVRLMKWKLSRGKFRPRLVELAASNSNESVKDASAKGIRLALGNKVEDAINALDVLKGVGPATASGILAACVPERCCFFADEVALAVLPVSSLKYNISEYQLLNATVVDIVNRLNKEIKTENKEADDEHTWTPHKVELAIWTHAVILKNKPELLSDFKRSAKESTGSIKKRRLN
ncbi:hypothetical protein SK128_024729 [Halocaridina rubra]|uniref:Uncharacterized protein n=1 Tax=Halocaridina rubra TaxID=373956 RepID=A0AAN8XAJ2_HALRR